MSAFAGGGERERDSASTHTHTHATLTSRGVASGVRMKGGTGGQGGVTKVWCVCLSIYECVCAPGERGAPERDKEKNRH